MRECSLLGVTGAAESFVLAKTLLGRVSFQALRLHC